MCIIQSLGLRFQGLEGTLGRHSLAEIFWIPISGFHRLFAYHHPRCLFEDRLRRYRLNWDSHRLAITCAPCLRTTSRCAVQLTFSSEIMSADPSSRDVNSLASLVNFDSSTALIWAQGSGFRIVFQGLGLAWPRSLALTAPPR